MKIRIFKIILVLYFALFTYNTTFAQDTDILYSTLPSGQRVVIKEVRDNPIVKIDTWIKTGSINEDDKNTGVSHFLEHLFFKGTQKYTTGEMDKILDSKGAYSNAATSKDFTHYHIQIPSKDFELALNLHSDMLLNPMIPRKELERERPVVIEEISKTKDSPTSRMFDNLYYLIYSKSNHPYKRTVIGKSEIIENISREEILDYYNKFYTPDAFVTVIVGDINKDDALKKVQTAFYGNVKKDSTTTENKKLKPKKQTVVKYPKILPLEKIERVSDKMDINKSHLMIAFLAPKFGANDTYALDVLATMLADGKSSILNYNLKEKKDLVLSVSSGNYSQKDSGIFYVYSTFDPEKEPKIENKIENEIINELIKIREGNFDEKTIEKAKNYIKTQTYYARESISNIADELGYNYTFSNDTSYYDNYLKNIEKVSKKDIIRTAKLYVLPDKYAVSLVEPVNINKNQNKDNIKEISNIDISHQDDNLVKLIEEANQEGVVKKFKFQNGLTLITKNKKINSIVAIDIGIKGSKALEKKPATAMLAAALAQKDTKNFTFEELANFLDENGIKLAINSSSDDFSILLQTTKENLDKAFVVLDEVLNKPKFLEGEVEKIKARKIKELSTVKDNPSSFVFDEFKHLAFQNTIYGQNSDFLINAIKKVSKDDIEQYYSMIINPENMVVSVVGDVDNNYIQQKLNSIIKTNPNGKKFSYSNQNFSSFVPTENIEKTFFKDEVQANWLALGYKIPGILNRREITKLNIINSILGSGMSSRLFVKLREEKGLAYTVGSTLLSNVLDGAFICYIGTNEKSVEEAKKGILSEIETLKKEMVTTKELNDVKDKIIGKLLLSLETNMDEADLYSRYALLGYNLNALEEYKKMIMEITSSDIIEAANKYFSKPYIYTAVKSKK